MALIIEDGTIVTGATSYCSVSDARAYASARGITLSATDSVVEVMIIKAMDYLEAIQNFKGEPVTIDQSLNWPRENVAIGLNIVAIDVIPAQLKKALNQLVLHINDGVDINPITTGAFVVEETVGPIKTKYSEAINTDVAPTLPLVDALLSPLISSSKPTSGAGGFLSVTRI